MLSRGRLTAERRATLALDQCRATSRSTRAIWKRQNPARAANQLTVKA